jgi:hypothetical protein
MSSPVIASGRRTPHRLPEDRQKTTLNRLVMAFKKLQTIIQCESERKHDLAHSESVRRVGKGVEGGSQVVGRVGRRERGDRDGGRKDGWGRRRERTQQKAV